MPLRHAPFFIADAVVCSEMAGVFRGKGRGWLGEDRGASLYDSYITPISGLSVDRRDIAII